MRGHISLKKVLSLLMALALILTLLPATVFAADTGKTLYLKPNSNWLDASARFAAYFFGNGEKWVSMTDSDGDGVYEVTAPTGYPKVIFCRMNPNTTADNWNNKWDQTNDLTVPTNDNNCYTIAAGAWSNGNGSWSVYTYVEPTYTVVGTAELCGNAWSLDDESNDMVKNASGVYEKVYTNVAAGTHKIKIVRDRAWAGAVGGSGDTDGNYVFTVAESGSTVTITFNAVTKALEVLVTVPETPIEPSENPTEPSEDPTEPSEDPNEPEKVTYEATFHFVNTLNWGTVNLYSWVGTGTQLTGGWPGTAITADSTGYYTYTVTSDTAGVNFIFNNGSSQTVDLVLPATAYTENKAEVWVVLTTQTDGKYNATIMDDPSEIVMSPVVDGSTVTFNYGDSSATTVAVAGSFNGWSATATPMTKNADGIWTATVTDLAGGDYQYKFVVNAGLATETWRTDPMNGNVFTESDGNQNSVFYILGDSNVEDDNKVTIHIHYSRTDGNYTGWNLWVWGSKMGGHQVDFESTDETGAKVATIVLEDAREHQSISFKERLSVDGNEWKAEADAERFIDLATVVSGTIDYYLPAKTCVYGDDVIRKNKVSSVALDYDNGTIAVTTVQAITDPAASLTLKKDGTVVEGVTITAAGSKYSLALPANMDLNLAELYRYQVFFEGAPYKVAIAAAYASDKFASEYTYTGNDLGATYSSTGTTFRLWAPTAEAVSVVLYATGSDAEAGAEKLDTYSMTKDVNGTWLVTVGGDLNGIYYTYSVNVDGDTVETNDPYSVTTGVNGKRSMVIDLDSTDPVGWADDTNPNPVDSQTDAIIYELHVRDFSIDSTSGVSAANRGKYLAFTEEGTTTPNGTSTGIDYLDELGFTHLHLLPVYDYGSVDETTCSNFNWGYDPVNYNVPEGSYSTNPYDGAVRVKEFKQMVQSLHEHDISVVMDVVYNHVYNADKFCFNQIVPGYFSRVDSNRSGCGNDTASEREMVRKYIVESVLYWHKEYHIDGFRFDLVGLLDVETINQIVTEVHACCPDVIFYGEGWDMDSTNKEPGTEMAKQGNASKTPGFAYFSDSIRNNLGGDNGNTTGFASGAGNGSAMVKEWLGNPWWTSNPEQVIQYASCHDNYTLADKIIISTKKSQADSTVEKMNNLAAAFYMTSQGVPFIHAGEELLRQKINADGSRNHNSYNASDEVNKIVWTDLEEYADISAYYQGLIAFRKAHPALRYNTAALVKANVQTLKSSGNLIVMRVDGNAAGDTDDILVIFNAASSAATVNLPEGEWTINVQGAQAGTAALGTASSSVSVAGISAMVLTKADEGKDEKEPLGPSEEKTIYFSNNKHWSKVYAYSWTGTTYQLGAWPGKEMTYVETNDYGESIYSITLPASETGIEGLIFHNNADAQTVDVEPGVDGTGYYCAEADAEGKFQVGTYTYSNPSLGDEDEYFLNGWINGADYVGDGYKFDENGTLTTTFAADSYVYVLNGTGTTYMTDGYQGAVSSVTMYNTAKHTLTGTKWDKLLIPGGDEVVITLLINSDNTVTLSYESTTSAVVDNSGIQDGVTLHCWNWSFDNITANMATIASQGYTAIQTSPVQPLKEDTNNKTVGGSWWVYYQPVDFVITDGTGNPLGTKEDFEDMCAEAEKYGIQVIVDVVVNHLGNKTGNDLADAIPEYLRKDAYWHDISKNITDWNDRYNMTQYSLSGLPDLNTANKEIQGYVLDFLKECVDAGADGFRFDMAKSIETPKDDASFASDFWPTVVGGIQEYAGDDLYIYGEVLDDPKIAISAYTQYMSVTDNGWGNHMRTLVASDKAELVAGFYKSAPASNLVIWAESHDTFATDDISQSSAGVSEADIIKTWALVAARADAMGLYFARPASTTQLIGVASATGWDNAEVKAVNQFHNVFVGQSEKIGNENGVSYVVRGTSGAVLVQVSGAANVEVAALGLTDGKYTDQITGNTFTVANGKISGTIGATGVAVVMPAIDKFEITQMRMQLNESLAAQIAVPKANMADWTGCYAVVSMEGKEDKTIYAEDWGTVGTFWGILYEGMHAKEMMDEFTVVIYNADGQAISNPYTNTLANYSITAFNNNKTAAGKELYVEMLYYGAAAQEAFDHKADTPATNVMTDAMKAVAAERKDAALPTDSAVSNTMSYQGSRLQLVSIIQLDIGFKVTKTDGMTVKAYYVNKLEDGKNVAVEAQFLSTSTVGVSVTGLKLVDCSELVTVEVYDANGALVASCTDSARNWAARNIEKDMARPVLNFCEKMDAFF